jgi:hypothetical protein
MKLLSLLPACLALAACANLERLGSSFEPRDSDYAAVASQSLRYIEMRGPVDRFVVAAGVDPRVFNALKSQRPSAAKPGAEPPHAVPNGTFVLTDFRIADGEAWFEGTLGTVRDGVPCDLEFTIPWYLQKNNDWYNPSYKIESCDKRVELRQ